VGSRYGLQMRGASAEDAADVAALLEAAGWSASPADVSLRLAAMVRAPGSVLLAIEWGPPSGLVAVHWTATLLGASPVGWISTLLVDPGSRRRGIGRMLLKGAAQAARQAGCDRLALAPTPEAAGLQEFGESTGFEPFGSVMMRPLRKRSAPA
jgi:aminoglycoside 6'-N-acetyltransferase I